MGNAYAIAEMQKETKIIPLQVAQELINEH